VVLLDEGHDLAGVLAAYPAPYCATGSALGSRPRVRRLLPPPYDHGLVRSPHTQGNQQGNHRTLYRAPGPLRCEPRPSNGSPLNRRQITALAPLKQGRTAGRVRHRPRSLEDSERRSPLIIKNLNPYPQPPNQHPLTNTQQRRTTRGLCDRCLSSCGWLRRHRC